MAGHPYVVVDADAFIEFESLRGREERVVLAFAIAADKADFEEAVKSARVRWVRYRACPLIRRELSF